MKTYLKVRSYTIIISLFWLFSNISTAQTTKAQDKADNYGSDWSGNGGSNFQPWVFAIDQSSGNSGKFLETNANSASPAVSTNNKSFGTFANGGGFPQITAFREFSQSLGPGDSFTVEIQHGGITNGGSMGFTLRSGNVTNIPGDYNTDSRFEVVFVGGTASYQIIANSNIDTGIGFNSNGLRVKVTLCDLNTVICEITELNTNAVTTFKDIVLGGTADSNIVSTALFNRNAGANVYYNNLEIKNPFTTVADGDFFDGSTWDGGVAPTNGNSTFNINHNVNLDSDLDLACNMTIASTKTLTVNSDVVLLNSSSISLNGSLLFKSDATNTAQYGNSTGTISGSGVVTVERFIPAKRAYRLLTSPVTTTDFIFENWQENGSTPPSPNGLGIQITGGTSANGFDQNGSGNPSMFSFDNTNSNGGTQTDDWIEIPNTNATKLTAGEPYLTFVRGDRSIDLTSNSSPATETTLRASGDLFTGSFSPTLSTTNAHYSLVANPYQAIFDYSLASRTDLTDFIYIWDASIGGDNGRGGYVTVDVSSNTITDPDPTSSDASKFIAPGLAFFVQNSSSGTIAPNLTFNEDDKATGENEVTVFNTYPNFFVNSRLYKSVDLQNGNTESDAIGLRFSDSYTTLADDEDAGKLFNPGENYAIVNNGLRSIDKQAIPTLGHQIDLSITNYDANNYSLTFVMENKPAGLGVFIVDNYLNTQTELTDTFVYEFTVDTNIPESIAADRFSLIFDNTTLGIEENTFGSDFRLYPNPSANGQFSISTPGLNGEVTVEMTNLLGQNVYTKELPITGTQVDVNAPNLTQGIYVVKLTQDNQSFSTKLIVE